MVVSVLVKIKLEQAQISGPKISIPMSKTAYINPWWVTYFYFLVQQNI